MSGLFKGVTATLLREIPGNAAWFGVYEASRKVNKLKISQEKCMIACHLTQFSPQYFSDYTGKPLNELPAQYTMLAGGVSGMSYWTAFFPADTVKSRIQTDPKLANESFTSIFKMIYKEGGARALYKVCNKITNPLFFVFFYSFIFYLFKLQGWGITVSRALPSNAVLFLTYEIMAKFFR